MEEVKFPARNEINHLKLLEFHGTEKDELSPSIQSQISLLFFIYYNIVKQAAR